MLDNTMSGFSFVITERANIKRKNVYWAFNKVIGTSSTLNYGIHGDNQANLLLHLYVKKYDT